MPNDHLSHLLPALLRRRFLTSSWPWRALAYLVTTAPLAGCLAGGLSVLALPWLVTARRITEDRPWDPRLLLFMLFGAALLAVLAPPVSVGLAAVERGRLGIVDHRPVTSPHRPEHTDPLRWLRVRLSEAATWREVGYAGFLATVVPLAYGALTLLVLLDVALVLSPWLVGHDGGPITVGFGQLTTAREAVPYAVLGFVLLLLLPYLVGLLAGGQAAVARALLADRDFDSPALREVTRSRARLVDGYEAQRRRIERDLHDGAQHQLTSLTLQIAMARLDVPADSPATVALDLAHRQAKELMVLLRGVVHGIHPQSLTDLGLAGAVRNLAAGLPVPVTVTQTEPWTGRLPDAVENTAYFVAAEALTNVARHSGASRAQVRLAQIGSLLVMEIRDDGTGGADPGRGTGLTGLSDRVAAAGGRLLLASPAGGPTVVRVELPCQR